MQGMRALPFSCLLVFSSLFLTACTTEHVEQDKPDKKTVVNKKEVSPDSLGCQVSGPQAPRDISQFIGSNPQIFALAPPAETMNLCNIHFHTNAEHKGRDFSVFAGEGEHGHGGGYQCSMSKTLSKKELTPYPDNQCQGVKPGDTVEVHWVHSSCVVKPGKGLGSCMTEQCKNPNLRVESQIFTVVNDDSAMDFMTMSYQGNQKAGYHQAKALPTSTGEPVEFLGSTTGPKYNNQSCSPMSVTWAVRPKCAKVSISSLSRWCEGNVFEETEAHGVRRLVVNPKLLSKIH